MFATWICCFGFLLLLLFGHAMQHEILVPWPGIEPVPCPVELWSLNHWTTREVPELFLGFLKDWVFLNVNFWFAALWSEEVASTISALKLSGISFRALYFINIYRCFINIEKGVFSIYEIQSSINII